MTQKPSIFACKHGIEPDKPCRECDPPNAMWPHCKTCKMPWKRWDQPECKCHTRMTDKQILAAKMSLVCAYLEKFDDPPDKATEMLMDLESTLARVHAGEKFQWEQDGSNWRVLRWGSQNAQDQATANPKH